MIDTLHPYWVEFAQNAYARGQEPASWLALFNGTDWNVDPVLTDLLARLSQADVSPFVLSRFPASF